ncbi:MAG: cytochrome c-type biogenesis protein CcmH [Gemmatimonadetes bacterium]|nr:cytochrome c-type biogenesis protein CcmH [Gemmatimonadota bacterium]
MMRKGGGSRSSRRARPGSLGWESRRACAPILLLLWGLLSSVTHGAQAARVQQAAVDPFADPRVRQIESQLRCSCGCNLDTWTCQRQMSCEVSPSMAAQVRRRLAEGADAPAILAEFVAERGAAVLMAPPKQGFNWVGYLLPFVALGVGAAAVIGLIRRWSRAAPAADSGATELGEAELAQIEAELERLDEDL